MASTSILKQRVKISPDVLFQEISGECVLLDLKSENYFGLDEVGTRIWQLIEECGGELRTVFDRMAAEYHVDSAVLERDLKDLMTRLCDNGLIEILSVETNEQKD